MTANDKLADEIERQVNQRAVFADVGLEMEQWHRILTVLRAERPQSVRPVFQAFASGTVQWEEEKCEQCGKTIILNARPQSGEPTEDEKRKIVASLLLQLWITLPQIPAGTMPNYEQAWDIAKSVLAAAEAERRPNENQ